MIKKLEELVNEIHPVILGSMVGTAIGGILFWKSIWPLAVLGLCAAICAVFLVLMAKYGAWVENKVDVMKKSTARGQERNDSFSHINQWSEEQIAKKKESKK